MNTVATTSNNCLSLTYSI